MPVFVYLSVIQCFCLLLVHSRIVRKLTCPLYFAQGTSSTTKGYCTCNINLCPTDSISVSVLSQYCNSTSSGSQYVRVFAGTPAGEIASSPVQPSCSLFSKLSMSNTLTECSTVALRQGCVDDSSCQAVLQILAESSTSQISNFLRGTEEISNISTLSSSSFASSCQYIYSSTETPKKSNLTITSIVIYSLVFGVAALCCFGKLAVFRRRLLCNNCKSEHDNRVYTEIIPSASVTTSSFPSRSLYPEADVTLYKCSEVVSVQTVVPIVVNDENIADEKIEETLPLEYQECINQNGSPLAVVALPIAIV